MLVGQHEAVTGQTRTFRSSVDDKGYPRIGAGPMRGIRLHRIVAAAKLGRPLKADEDVHHVDGDKLNFAPDNLKVMGHQQHGCISAKQHHYLKERDIELKSEWEEFFEHERSEGGGGRCHLPVN